MIPGMNPNQMAGMMKKMGISQTELNAKRVIFELEDSKLVIENPSVLKIKMQGQETYQVTGEATEEELELFTMEDVEMVSSQVGCSTDEAKDALEKSEGDIAQAIMDLKE